jgi:ribosomal protein S12 methylthiotransferase accessory factor
VNEFTHLLQDAADLLIGAMKVADATEQALQLLSMLGYQDADAAQNRRRACLLRGAAKLRRLFQLSAPDAAGLVFFGGEADPSLIGWSGTGHAPVSVAGGGLSLAEAFEACAAEGVEYLSQFGTAADVERHDSFNHVGVDGELGAYVAAVLDSVGVDRDRPIAWIKAKRLCDDGTVWLPADMCLRRSRELRDFIAPFKLSTGCAAGASFDDAVIHGLCELVERDAVALWWRGGLRGRMIASNSDAGEVGAQLLVALRGGSMRRRSWLLDITADVGVPCVAAVSTTWSGQQFVCGHAARPSRVAAVRAAILEMCQMELGLAVIAAKVRERGEAALNAADHLHLRRARGIDAANCEFLNPTDPAPAEQEPALTLQGILDRLAHMEVEPLVLDLTRPVLGIPVARVLAPTLQLEPSPIPTKRLARAIEQTGGGKASTRGIALL